MRLLLIICCLLLMSAASQCSRDRDPHPMDSIDDDAVKEDIAALSNGSRRDDPDAEHLYNKARDNLIKYGSTIEPHILFELEHGKDWAVRYGCIEVLDGVGTRKCIEPLIACLEDEHPLVAQKAMYSLRVFCGHKIVPKTDSPSAPVPPIPQRKPDESMQQDYSNWVSWYKEYGKALHQAWMNWYQANKADITVE